MIYGMMAQMDEMTEETALELVCKIVLKEQNRLPARADT